MKQNLQILYCLGNETRIILKTSRENDYARKLLHKECFGNRSVVSELVVVLCLRLISLGYKNIRQLNVVIH
ncbi:unnamed protein product [Rhizophagus irregularis]|nr:unnamed protein product [Rhizophagus irregularis]